jgi:phosphohistidine swiveling domain-containing protein
MKKIKKPKQKRELLLERVSIRDYITMILLEAVKNVYKKEAEIDLEHLNPLVRYLGKGYIKSYQYTPELDKAFQLISEKAKSKLYVKKIAKKCFNSLSRIRPYFNKEKIIRNKKDLQFFYTESVKFITLGELVQLILDCKNVPEDNKKIALKARKKTHEYMEIVDKILRKGIKAVMKEFTKKEIKFLMPEEIFGGKKIKKEEIEKRKSGYVYYKKKIYTGKAIERLIKEKNIKFDDEVELKNQKDILKGQIAYIGKVKGNVKIVSTIKDISKVNKGDVLVSSMTLPKYILAMKKAVAFLTDEGGIGCHAAILSREMKKPCIIGTKIATKVLKDGDLVEVDANNGIVKILKKAK